MAFARTVLHTKALARPSSGSEDKVYGVDYVSLTSHSEAVSGADVGGIPYCPTATTETTSANLTYTTTSGPRLQVGSGSATSAGLVLGYLGASGNFGIWRTGITPDTTNYAYRADSGSTYVNGAAIRLAISDTTRFFMSGTAGAGAAITAGTATTDVQALSVTQTWNAAGVAFTGKKSTFTLTAYHANSLLEDWRSASASLFAIHNTGAFGGVGTTFANAPSAPWTGMIQNFTDSNTATWGATIAGGGANNVLARYNGANWTVVGA